MSSKSSFEVAQRLFLREQLLSFLGELSLGAQFEITKFLLCEVSCKAAV